MRDIAERISFDEAFAMNVETAILGDPIAAQQLMANEMDPEPRTHIQAMASTERKFWLDAEAEELRMVAQFQVWGDPVLLPPGKKALNQGWVYKRKRDDVGRVRKYKARLTPKGCAMVYGVDYVDTYAPVARMTSVRYTLAMAAMLGLQVSGIDFTNAFLNAPLIEDVYVNAPPG